MGEKRGLSHFQNIASYTGPVSKSFVFTALMAEMLTGKDKLFFRLCSGVAGARGWSTPILRSRSLRKVQIYNQISISGGGIFRT